MALNAVKEMIERGQYLEKAISSLFLESFSYMSG